MAHSGAESIAAIARVATAAGILGLTPVVDAADPPRQSPPASVSSTAATQDRSPATPAAPRLAAAPRPPLDLKLGETRRYLSEAQLDAVLGAASEATDDRGTSDEVVVEGERAPAEPLPEDRPIPMGLAAPFWALFHPLKAWRILFPDPNARPIGPPENEVPPPVRY